MTGQVEKDWKFESFDLTVSTVNSDDLSEDSDSEDFEAPLIIETPLGRRNHVRFACDDSGAVLCSVREFERANDQTLWWSPEESEAIIQDCCITVKYYQGRPRLCTLMTNLLMFKWFDEDHPLGSILDFLQDQDPQVSGRGLEQHVVGTSKHYVMRHRRAVLAAQEDLRETFLEGSSEAARAIGKVAAMTSRDCKALAHRVALYDEGEACNDEEDDW